MKHAVPHDLEYAKAKVVADAAFESYKRKLAKYRPQTQWVTDRRATITFTVKGITLRGALELNEDSIDMELDVPFILRPFRGKALSLIEREIRAWIEKAKAGVV
jgi:hypothetical protein